MCNADAGWTLTRRGRGSNGREKSMFNISCPALKIILFHLYFNGNYDRYRILNKIIRVEANKWAKE